MAVCVHGIRRSELEPAGGVPLPRVVPAVAARRRACAGPRVEHVPDERPTVAGIDTLDGNAQPPAPTFTLWTGHSGDTFDNYYNDATEAAFAKAAAVAA